MCIGPYIAQRSPTSPEIDLVANPPLASTTPLVKRLRESEPFLLLFCKKAKREKLFLALHLLHLLSSSFFNSRRKRGKWKETEEAKKRIEKKDEENSLFIQDRRELLLFKTWPRVMPYLSIPTGSRQDSFTCSRLNRSSWRSLCQRNKKKTHTHFLFHS